MIIFPGALEVEANFNAQFRDAYYLGEPLRSTVTLQKRQRSRQDRSSWYFVNDNWPRALMWTIILAACEYCSGTSKSIGCLGRSDGRKPSVQSVPISSEGFDQALISNKCEAPVLSGRSKYAKRWRRWAMTHFQEDLVH